MMRVLFLSLTPLVSVFAPPANSQNEGYTLSSGDSIRVYVYGEPDLTFESLLIGQNGSISYPFLGDSQPGLTLRKAITLCTGLVVYFMQPIYRAAASIILESEEANVVNVEQVYSPGAGNYSSTYTQYEILRSRSPAERVVRKLQRDVEANRQLYDIFFTRIKTVSETGGFKKAHARLVDRARIPGGPVKPNKRLILSVAFLLSIMLGCGIAVLLDVLDNTVKSPDDVLDKLKSPLLGTIPKQKVGQDGEFPQFWQNTQGEYAESIRTIRTGVVLSGLDNPAGIIVVTSTVPGEGKSTTALNLGAAMAQMENTLVIGADLRRPSLAQKCALSTNHRGLSHFVSGTAELENCIEYLEDLKLHVMPAGVIPPNPLEMISSKRFVDALAVLRERFDRIIIDSAPVQAVSDALILASYADSVIYVVKADATSATQAQKGIASIVASNEPLTGVVLNHFDAKKASQYHYGGKSDQYGDYYQSEEPA